MNLLLALLITVTAQAENNFDLWGKENLAWTEENRKIASTISDIALYSLIGSAIVYTSAERSLKHGLAATATLGVNAGLNQLVKHTVQRERPDGSDRLSFYSGHTSASFASASILCLSKKKLCAPGLSIALLVGYLRISANKHWLSDVGVGAAIGYVNGRYAPLMVIKW